MKKKPGEKRVRRQSHEKRCIPQAGRPNVYKFPPKKDEEDMAYFPICIYRSHMGVIKNDMPCIERKCNHYFRAYISDLQKVARRKRS
tara:strand:+ start:395 stop:655 length:261 start_codon:yes stop_codon:yes gene_type:complete